MKSKLAKQVFHLSSRKNTKTFLFAKVYPFLFGGIKSSKILLTLNTKTSLFCSVIKSSPILLSSLIFLLVLSCETNKTPVSPVKPEISLTVEDVLVTEAWLKVQVERATENRHISLWRDSSEVYNGVLKTTDTTLYDSGLLPNRNYTYTAYLWRGEKIAARSKSAKAHTMDTTSHNFTWEITEFGGVHGSSVLYDVAIVNENEIWAVGEIHTAETDTFDSTGNWVPPYNAVHWDGSEWELIRTEDEGYGYGENYAVFALSPNDVWIGSTIPEHWDGNNWKFHGSVTGYPGGFRIRKIWRTSSSNLYFVGDGGNIVHYNGQRWIRLVTNTDLDFCDIWGAFYHKTGEWEILAVASKEFVNFNRLILKISPNSQTILSDLGINWSLSAVWFSPGRKYFVAGAGIYEKERLSEEKWKNGPLDITHYYTHGIRGNDINDVVAAGGAGEVIHFNGMSWKSFFNVTQLGYGNYYAVSINDDLVAVVGQDVPRGIIALGRRNP